MSERGRQGMQYEKPSFSVAMGGTDVELTPKEREEKEKRAAERKAEEQRVHDATRQHLNKVSSQKVTRKLVPWGTRILVKRRKVEDRSEHIILPDEVKNLPTDIADVVCVPDQTFVDVALLQNAQTIVKSLTDKANSGDAAALDSLIKYKEYLCVMSLKVGDVILMARYGGTDFLIQETNQYLTVTDANGIYARVVEIAQ